jgi:PAS domain S-box-containing protein
MAALDHNLFYDAFNASPIGIVLENLEGQPLFANPFLCSMLGFSEEEMRSKHCVDFSPPEDAEKDWALFEQLRAGLIDRYQIEKRFIRRDGSLVWARLSISLLSESSLVVAMVENITEKRTAEEARSRHAAIIESSRDAIISKNLDGIIESWNAGAQRIFGYVESEVVGQPIAILIPRELWDQEQEILERLRTGHHIEHYETIRVTKAGGKLDVSLSISPIKDSSGRIVGFSSIVHDITERKLAEAALASVTRKLIDAQEQERTRIGRELHDDMGQRLAMVAIELQQLHEDPLLVPEIRRRTGELQKEITEIADDIQSLSHKLHSAKLQYLGIAAAMRSFCHEFGEQHNNVEIDFNTHDLPSPLSPEISLCFFRVLQEALHNSAKHSGARNLEVRLWGTSDALHLTVRDSGTGFDLEAAKNSRGLGLISMQERLKLLNGALTIESKPQRGTTIHARVPLRSDGDSMRVAG